MSREGHNTIIVDREEGGELDYGERIRKLRELANLPLSAAAPMLGISRSHLCRLESGERRLDAERIGEAERQLVPLARREASVLLGVLLPTGGGVDMAPRWLELFYRRKRARMTQAQAAKALGLTNLHVVSRMERNDQPIPDDVLEKVRGFAPAEEKEMNRNESLRLLRRVAGLNLEEAAPLLGLHPTNLCHHENGRRPVGDALWLRAQRELLPRARKTAELVLPE